MKLICCASVILLAAVFLVFAQRSDPIRIQEIQVKPLRGNLSYFGNVYGVRRCGGQAKLRNWRVNYCHSESICRIPAEGHLRGEVDFIPSKNIDRIGTRFNVQTKGTKGPMETMFEKPFAGKSWVRAGELYRAKVRGFYRRETQGTTSIFQYIIYRVGDNSVELCAEADFEII